jgi:hypothetical protein
VAEGNVFANVHSAAVLVGRRVNATMRLLKLALCVLAEAAAS